MAEYIKREEVYQYLDNEVEWNVNQDRLYALEVISDFPAADVAEVRHGRWIRQPSEISGLDVEFCSECGQGMNERNQFWNAKYCPHCGARMDEEDEHEAS